VWEQCIETAPAGKVTAAHVERVVGRGNHLIENREDTDESLAAVQTRLGGEFAVRRDVEVRGASPKKRFKCARSIMRTANFFIDVDGSYDADDPRRAADQIVNNIGNIGYVAKLIHALTKRVESEAAA
jgi:hypothetical protein